LLQGREPVVDVDLHKISTFTVVSAKVHIYCHILKDSHLGVCQNLSKSEVIM
jgi:hypothetical protein